MVVADAVEVGKWVVDLSAVAWAAVVVAAVEWVVVGLVVVA